MLFWTAGSDNTTSTISSNSSNSSNIKKSSSISKTADERCILTERLQWYGEGYGQGHIPTGKVLLLLLLSLSLLISSSLL